MATCGEPAAEGTTGGGSDNHNSLSIADLYRKLLEVFNASGLPMGAARVALEVSFVRKDSWIIVADGGRPD